MDYREPQDGDFQKLTELLSQPMANQSPQLQPPQARAMPNYAPGLPFSHPQTPTPSYSQSRATPSRTCAQTREPAAYASRPGYPNKGASKDKTQSSTGQRQPTPTTKTTVAFNACSDLRQAKTYTAYTAAPRGLSPAFGAMHGTSIPFRAAPNANVTTKQSNILSTTKARPYVRSNFHSGFANSAVANFPPPVIPSLLLGNQRQGTKRRAPKASAQTNFQTKAQARTASRTAANARQANSRDRQAPLPPPQSLLMRLVMFPVYLILFLVLLIFFPFMLLKHRKE